MTLLVRGLEVLSNATVLNAMERGHGTVQKCMYAARSEQPHFALDGDTGKYEVDGLGGQICACSNQHTGQAGVNGAAAQRDTSLTAFVIVFVAKL